MNDTTLTKEEKQYKRLTEEPVVRKSASSGDLQPQSHGDIWATLPMPSIRTHRPMVIPL